MDIPKEIHTGEQNHIEDAGPFIDPAINEKLAEAGVEDSGRFADIHSHIEDIHGPLSTSEGYHRPSPEGIYTPPVEKYAANPISVAQVESSASTGIEQFPAQHPEPDLSYQPAAKPSIAHKVVSNVLIPLNIVAESLKGFGISLFTKRGNPMKPENSGHTTVREVHALKENHGTT